MNVSEEDLRATYESLETERLLELQARGTLTETAARVLEQVLTARAVSNEERAKLAAAAQKRVAEETDATDILASLGERIGAQLIDSFVAVAVLIFTFLLSIVVSGALVAGSVLFFAYLLFADGLPRGQSLGKRALGIAVIDQRTREPCTYPQSLLRNVLLLLLGFLDWVFIFGRTRQRLGDTAAKTQVVRLDRMLRNPLQAPREDARA